MPISEKNKFTCIGVIEERTSESTNNGKTFLRVLVSTDGWYDQDMSEEDAPYYEPASVCFDLFGKASEKIGAVANGSTVKFVGYLESRKGNQGGWFTSPRVTSTQIIQAKEPDVSAAATAAPAASATATPDNIPF